MNFATFSAVGSAGTHFVTSGGQLQSVAKLQQNANNGSSMTQVVGMVGSDGVQYVRAMDAPHLISVPIALPGAKPGDPQPTMQIQVLSPNMTMQQQQPKYQMQIPIQGFQQGAVLTLAYSPEAGDATGFQLMGQHALPEGMQVVTVPTETQAAAPEKEHQPPAMHQVFITPNQQVIINRLEDVKNFNNNTTMANINSEEIIIKEGYDENMDDESSQGTCDVVPEQITGTQHEYLVKYFSQLPPKQAQALPQPLQQFLRLNPAELKTEPAEVTPSLLVEKQEEPVAEAILSEDGTLRIQTKKKKKYKKKPPKPVRPKPGRVVITQASDGTPVFCCPECQFAYPQKEQLEMHLSVHKIDRRFICGICGAGLKRKEHLERHKLGHNPDRPYVCDVCRKGFKRREHLNLHSVIHTGVKTEMCPECGKGFYRKDHLRKHTRSHESKRARDEAADALLEPKHESAPAPAPAPAPALPEITIHVPTSGSRAPVQINIPAHLVSALQTDAQSHIDALLAQHS